MWRGPLFQLMKKDHISRVKCTLCYGEYSANFNGCQSVRKHHNINPKNVHNNLPRFQSKNFTSTASGVNDIKVSHDFNSTLDLYLPNIFSELSSLITPLFSLFTALLKKLNLLLFRYFGVHTIILLSYQYSQSIIFIINKYFYCVLI